MRISTEDYFMEIAEIVKKRSSCIKQEVGAVLVKDKHIIATGYNGAPRGLEHCNKNTCLRQDLKSLDKAHLCRGVHAEQNTIIQAAVNGVSTDGTCIYTTHFPCMSCMKILINAGVKEIVYSRDYDLDNMVKMKMVKDSSTSIRKWVKKDE